MDTDAGAFSAPWQRQQQRRALVPRESASTGFVADRARPNMTPGMPRGFHYSR